jgi:putative membrane protein
MMDQYYEYLKVTSHLILLSPWFVGLFYIVRLFVYQIEAPVKPSPEKKFYKNSTR